MALVLDHAPYHRGRAVPAMLSLYAQRVIVFWLPPYIPTLHPIERFWRHLKDVATANSLFASLDQLLGNIRRVLHAQNQPHRPLRLTFSHL
jgi:transposase